MGRISRMTHAAVSGTAGKLEHAVERPLARHTPLTRERIRTLAGALLLLVSVRRIVRALRAGLR